MKLDDVVANVRKQAAGGGVKCAVCAAEASGELTACAQCAAAYHSDCWAYNGGCAVYGCGAGPRREPLTFDLTPRRARLARWAMMGAFAVSCVMFGMAVGERNAAARVVEDVEVDEDMVALAGTLEIMEGAAEIESLRSVALRHRRADELIREVRGRLLQDAQFPVCMLPDPARNAIELRGPERFVSTIARALRELDVPAAMLMVEARVMVADVAKARAAGLTPPVADAAREPLQAVLFPVAGARAAALCEGLEQRGQLRTLASPRLQAADGELAEIAIGDTIAVSRAPGRRAESHETGVRVQVKPRLREAGRIQLDMELELTGVEALEGPLAGAVKDGRAVMARHGLLVGDGEEIILSGLAAPRFGPVPGSPAELLVLLSAHALAKPMPVPAPQFVLE